MAAAPKTLDLAVSGMTCGSCVRRVGGALRGVDGMKQVEVDLQQDRARVAHASDRASAEADRARG